MLQLNYCKWSYKCLLDVTDKQGNRSPINVFLAFLLSLLVFLFFKPSGKKHT